MQDPRSIALELLRQWGRHDAARALEQCTVALRHVDHPPETGRHARPQTDVLIAVPHDVISSIRHSDLPQGSWSGEVERALTEAMRDHYTVRAIQWSETKPADAPRPGTFGMPRRGAAARE